MSAHMKKDPEYLILPEVARRLGLGLRTQKRKNPKFSVTVTEKLARRVRELIHEGKLKAVWDDGQYIVREDWVEEYEAQRKIESKWQK